MRLDLGSGTHKAEGYTGMDIMEGADIVHDMEKIPWPIDNGVCTHVNASHVLEHIKPWKIIEVMDELWRVTKHKCEVDIRTPYGDFFRFDPTHCIHFMAPSWLYFDPNSPYYEIYKPKPWRLMEAHDSKDIKELHVILSKLEENNEGIP